MKLEIFFQNINWKLVIVLNVDFLIYDIVIYIFYLKDLCLCKVVIDFLYFVY